MNGKRVMFWGLFIGFIVVDQLVKLWVRHSLNQGQTLPLPFPGIFEIQLVFNQGIAYGLFQGKGVLLAPIAIAISGGSIWYTAKHPEESRWTHAAFALLASGAIGNLIDRLKFGKVTDMFWFRAIDFPVFNVADSCITVATVMLVLGWWREATVKKMPHPGETEPAAVE